MTNDELIALLDDVPSDWQFPDFDARSRVHDWRNYVPKVLRGVWTELAHQTRIVVAAVAEQRAGDELWD